MGPGNQFFDGVFGNIYSIGLRAYFVTKNPKRVKKYLHAKSFRKNIHFIAAGLNYQPEPELQHPRTRTFNCLILGTNHFIYRHKTQRNKTKSKDYSLRHSLSTHNKWTTLHDSVLQFMVAAASVLGQRHRTQKIFGDFFSPKRQRPFHNPITRPTPSIHMANLETKS